MISYVLIAIGALVLLAAGMLLKEPFGMIFKFIKNRSKLIKSYWVFSVLFSLFSILVYTLAFRYLPAEALPNYLSAISTGLTLIFAIFVGYFAFAAVVENRLDKIETQADEYMNAKDYLRAIAKYEEIIKSDKSDFRIMSNLLEFYLITKNVPKFDELYPDLLKIALDGKERLISIYLLAVRELSLQQMAQARSRIKELIEYIKSRPSSLASLTWGFGDIVNDTEDGFYRFLPSDGESKIILDNLVKYLGKRMNEKEKAAFEGHDFLVGTITE